MGLRDAVTRYQTSEKRLRDTRPQLYTLLMAVCIGIGSALGMAIPAVVVCGESLSSFWPQMVLGFFTAAVFAGIFSSSSSGTRELSPPRSLSDSVDVRPETMFLRVLRLTLTV